MKLIFCLLSIDKRLGFLHIATIILGVRGQACQIIQNNKFAIFLQYLKKEVSDEFDFLLADEHESLLQIDTLILLGTQGFTQAILMTGRQHKKLNLLTEFSNSVFIKLYFKAYWC